MVKKVILVLIFVFIATIIIAFNPHRLKNIDDIRVAVRVNTIDELSNQQLRTDVELKLRLAGIHIWDYEAPSEPGDAELYVKVTGLYHAEFDAYIFKILIELHQYGYWKRDPGDTEIPYQKSVLWERDTLGIVSKKDSENYIRNIVKDFMDEFLNDYLSVNPK